MNEFELIAHYIRPLTRGKPEALNLQDDAAIIPGPQGLNYIITKDAITEGVHFPAHTSPENIARKLLRTNLSDMAAMGAEPRYYLIAGLLPESVDEAFIKRFTSALAEENTLFNIATIGGDTTRIQGPVAYSLTMIGVCPQGSSLLRSGARAEDDIYVTGTIGDGTLGWMVTEGQYKAESDADNAYLIERYEIPSPRIAAGMALRGIAHAAIDISDGLVADLRHICHCSQVGATIQLADIPLSEPAKAYVKQKDGIEALLTGGDDYELLFTAPQHYREIIEKLAKNIHIPITRIGQITYETRQVFLDEQGKEVTFEKAGFSHF